MPDGYIIYKGNLARRVDAADVGFWLAAGWSMTKPEGFSGNTIDDTTVSAPGSSNTSEFVQTDTVVATLPDGSKITYGMLFESDPGTFPPPGQLTHGEFQREYGAFLRDFLNEIENAQNIDDGLLFPTVSGGGGGGASGPTYVKPDERLVRDAIEARFVALTGALDGAEIKTLIGDYMSEHKRAFDNRKTQQIDPMATVMAKIEGRADYQAIHELRPDNMDPMSWIADRQGAMLRAGVSAQRSNDLAIQQATVAATEQDAARAGEISTFNNSGALLPGFFAGLQNSARAALRVL